MRQRLICVPRAGLCNRLNAIVCALVIMRDSNLPIKIYWDKTHDCYAWFGELFKQIEWNYNGLSAIVENLESFYLKPATKSNLFLPFYLRKIKGICELKHVTDKTSEQIIQEYNKPLLYVTSYNRFCLHESLGMPYSKVFKPIDDIQNIINDVITDFSDNTIGIHIRRTDNVSAISSSPMEMFEKKIEKAISNDPTVKFYVASDSEVDKNYLLKRYGEHIITKQWDLSRNTLQGMKDAVAELYCLAFTKKIFGSGMSTYSLMASKLNGIELDLG